MKKILLSILFNCASFAFAQLPVIYQIPAAIPNTYFGMHVHNQTLWPAQFNPGSIRIWDVFPGQWYQVETSSGVYSWTVLDAAVATAQANNADIMYDLANTPVWASSNPSGTGCADATGTCYPPSDLSLSGSTWSSAIWSAWVTAVVQRYCGKITTYEVWNEPQQNSLFWKGTQAQLQGLAQIAYPIILSVGNCSVGGVNPNKVASPPTASFVVSTNTPVNWTQDYLSSGGAAYADVVPFHNYYFGLGATDIVGPISLLNSFIQNSSFSLNSPSKPLWDDEGSWGSEADLPYMSDRVAWLGKSYLTQWLFGVQRFYWYAYDDPSYGQMYSASGIISASYASGGGTCAVGDIVNVAQSGAEGGALEVISVSPSITLGVADLGVSYSTASGLTTSGGSCANSLVVNIVAGSTSNALAPAYGIVKGWMSGAVETGTRYSDGTWICLLQKGSTNTYAVWNDFGSGDVIVPAGMHHSTDLYGNVTSVTPGSTIPLSDSPFLLSI